MKKLVSMVAIAAMVVGAVATPVAVSATGYQHHRYHHHKKIKASPTSHGIKTPAWATYIGWAGGCSIIFLMLASTKKGGPTPLEAQMIVGNCFLPFIGGYLVEQAYKKNNGIQ